MTLAVRTCEVRSLCVVQRGPLAARHRAHTHHSRRPIKETARPDTLPGANWVEHISFVALNARFATPVSQPGLSLCLEPTPG